MAQMQLHIFILQLFNCAVALCLTNQNANTQRQTHRQNRKKPRPELNFSPDLPRRPVPSKRQESRPNLTAENRIPPRSALNMLAHCNF
jgi:hypothetical protein